MDMLLISVFVPSTCQGSFLSCLRLLYTLKGYSTNKELAEALNGVYLRFDSSRGKKVEAPVCQSTAQFKLEINDVISMFKKNKVELESWTRQHHRKC